MFAKFKHSVKLIRSFSTQIESDVNALGGINVVDFTRIIAGPYCTMMLGDLGANIIKVEHPDGGDECRKWGPPFLANASDSAYFLAINRNKKSICVDVKSEKGKELIYDLISKSDIFVENFVPGKLDKIGFGYEDLKKVNPQLIYCSITGFGPVGPYTNKPGYDVVAAGMGGLLGVTGEQGGGPVKVGVAVTDIATGLNAFGAIMAALLLRAKTGRGQKIDCNLLSTQIAAMINVASAYLNGGENPKRWGTAHVSIVPYQAFPTKDSHIIIGTGSDNQFAALCTILKVDYLAADERYSTNAKRVENREELLKILTEILGKKTTKEWFDLFKDAPFPNGPVYSMKEVFENEHVKAIGIVEEIDHNSGQKVKLVGPAVTYGFGNNKIRLAPPTLGQHTDDILAKLLNYDDNKIKDLKLKNIVK